MAGLNLLKEHEKNIGMAASPTNVSRLNRGGSKVRKPKKREEADIKTAIESLKWS